MIRLIRADLRRIFRTKGLYIFNVLLLLVLVLSARTEDAETFITSGKMIMTVGIVPAVSILILISIFSAEIHSGTIQGSIGSGVKRASIVRAKFIECVIFAAIEIVFMIIIRFAIAGFEEDVVLTDQASSNMVLSMIIDGIKIVSFVSLSSLVAYISWNVPSMILADAAFALALPVALAFLDQALKTTFSEIWVDSLFDNSYVSFTAGSFDIRFAAAIVMYIVLPVVFSAVIFKRKELEL